MNNSDSVSSDEEEFIKGPKNDSTDADSTSILVLEVILTFHTWKYAFDHIKKWTH